MVVDDDNVNYGGSRKRKRVYRKRKLIVNENVEVRSLEEGFLGSWNSGTVIRCGRQQRHVRYDNILEDNGSDYVVDVVTVSAVLDGEGVSGSTEHKERGIIRPIPPLFDIDKWDLPFALCVDVSHEEAWWEGVVFDKCNGMEERSIFFPDLGDEMKVKIQQLRITQDWDEVSESWKPRGKWVFLELIEECDRVSYVPVSIKQIYYDVRNRDDFVRIKEWTCSIKDLWKEPVMEVIGDYNTLTLSEVFQTVKLPGNLLIETLDPTANSVSRHVKVNEANNSCIPEKETMVQEEQQECVSPVQEVMIECQEEISPPLYNEKNREGKRTRARNISWQPVEVTEVQYCPDVIEQYAFGCESKTIRELLKDNVRKHLAYLGWTIESTEDKEYPGRPRRYRYKPPSLDTQDQEVFNSLLKACNYLQKGLSTHCSQHSQDQDAWPALAAPPSLSVKDLVEPEYCPEAVVKFYFYTLENRLDDKRKWRLRATKHLLAEGWILEYPNKNRRRALYKSPQNHRLETLQDACRVYLKAAIPKWIVSGMRRIMDLTSITEEGVDKGVDSDDILECVTQLLGKEPEFNIIDASPTSRSTENKRQKQLKTSRATPTKGKQNRSLKRVVQPCKRAQKVPAPSQSLPKPQNVISWLIDRNILVTRSKVFYRANRGRDPPVAEGRLFREGIKCSCCKTIYGLNGFATHATGIDDCRPSGNIFLKDGRSLLDCQIEVMHDDRTSETIDKPTTDLCEDEDENENSCSVCQSGGDLILCDQCPSAFHKECLGLEDIPDGDWFCPLCHCPNCRKSTTGKAEEGHFLTCSQCEHKYHVGCVRNRITDQSRRHPEQWLCGKECEQIYAGLHKLLGKPVSMGATDNLTWTLMKFDNSESSDVGNTTNDLLAECYSKLSVAVSVMHECFEPVNSPSSTRDLAEDITFSRWSKLPRSNYQGFYTILLEENEELISVANIRVYGEKVAEIPLVGTRFQHRRKGMCRILMNELEKMLMKLGVKRLVLPAVPDTLETWTKSFGFVKMTSSERSQFLDHIFLDFPETIMCQKVLTRSPSPDSDLTTEIQPKAPDVLSVKCRIEFDKSSSASEEEHVEEIHRRKRILCIEEGKQMVKY